ncbi:hypothetical protein Glove_18g124 [Diversispora epigaea]|uniref:SH3 domain-containing protein n=1 Tax=Diversispora epigaea TaxID=1348612 RepID=A0A397JT22_9GLOM|nr:hypothetical protein Glove_18g124 [Diversispora epigaea]
MELEGNIIQKNGQKDNVLTIIANGDNNNNSIENSESEVEKMKREKKEGNNSNSNSSNSNNSIVENTNTNFNPDNIDKDLYNKITETLFNFYNSGADDFYIGEPQKKKVRSSLKSLKSLKDDNINNINSENDKIKIRDFGFPIDDPRHWGQPYPISTESGEDEYINRKARALYDFQAENESELSFQEGDILLIQCRQCDGWLLADLGDETGLVPESYVALLGEGEEEEYDEYGDWAIE